MEPPKLTRQEFVAKTLAAVRQFQPATDKWHLFLVGEIAAIDHPRWDDPQAVKALLTRATARELPLIIAFMTEKIQRDPFYLTRLGGARAQLLALGRNRAPLVRGTFAVLLSKSGHWPADLNNLEPLLASSDPDVVWGVLWAFRNRGEIPSDRVALQRLVRTGDAFASRTAAAMLKDLTTREAAAKAAAPAHSGPSRQGEDEERK